ncbi:hypothetical protein PPYR_13199 [Photinus pyralis]|uniref:DRBM domain-containing protein n=1 Tax=Photinus pyralis TaxID=7054 RepID=A0A1Y1ML76_PHOPY|nr:double-stranded RNA-specific editase Adar-like isoform X2 [Photinus pyralis]KAB0793579.1 hypothetical protein PPYR_13199 [Photinus pyralis]
MSYNTRRGAFRGANQGQALRRPPPQQQQHNFQTMQERGRGDGPAPRQPAPQQMQQQHLRQQAEKYLQNQKPPQQQGNQLIIKQEPAEQPKPLMATKTIPPPAPIISETNAPQATNGGDIPPLIQEEGQPKEKPAWAKGGGKINKKELRRRRNLRLRKMLQPKNALMVLNELVGSTVYDVVEAPDLFSGAVFRCTVKVDGIDHVGLGKSKPSAKNAAAETALKYLVLSKVNKAPVADTPPAPVPETSETEIKMEIDENSEELSWSHVACYALHKLLSSWDEGVGVNLAEKVSQAGNNSFTGNDSTDSRKGKAIEKKPAKKLPENAHEMNPVMLLNQMVPHAVYEEVSKEGNPPNVNFNVKCTIGNDVFYGTATTKKGARKICAFAACRQVLGIQYAPAFLQEHNFSEDAVQVVLGPSTQAA